jgi:hypothetical protein
MRTGFDGVLLLIGCRRFYISVDFVMFVRAFQGEPNVLRREKRQKRG